MMHLEDLLKHNLLGPTHTPQGSDLAGLGQGLRISISSKLPGDADASGPQTSPGVNTKLQALPDPSLRLLPAQRSTQRGHLTEL